MNILFVSHGANRTGAPLMLLSFLRALREQAPSVSFDVLLLQDGELHQDFAALAEVFVLKKRKNLYLRVRRKLSFDHAPYKHDFRFVKDRNYDLIYANSVGSLSVGAEIKRINQAPLLLHAHESHLSISNYEIPKQDIEQCDYFIAASSTVKSALVNDWKIDHDRVTLVYPFSPYEIANEATQNSVHGKFNIGLSGYACWMKGVDLLPMVASAFSMAHPEVDCVFTWVGDITSKIQREIEYDAQRLGVKDKIRFTGQLSDPIQEYKSFDVFLLLSREDSFPMTCLENALLKKPIICMKNASGITDMLTEDSSVIVPYLSIEGISDAIYKLYSEPQRSSQLGEAACHLVATRFSKASQIHALRGIILGILSSKK